MAGPQPTKEERERALAIVAEYGRRKARPWRNNLFPQQLAVVEDKAPLVAAHPGRRGGKTHTVMAKIFEAMKDHPGQMCIYLALTRGSAKRIMWEELKRANQLYDMDLEFREVELMVRDPRSGSSCLLGGADDAASIERLRGGKYSFAGVDECGSFDPNTLSSLIREVIRPALGDLRGQLLLVGTPGPVCFGMFYDLCTDAALQCSVHHWTVLDNPHFPNPGEWLEDTRRIERFDEQHPIFRREYLGQWVTSSDALVYQYDARKNGIPALPQEGRYRYVLGIDYGYMDSTAWSVWAYEEGGRNMRVVESFKESRLTPGEVAKITLRLTNIHDFQYIVGDAGGLGKGYIEETKIRYGIPIRIARKVDKRGAIELLNGDLRSGFIKVVEPNNRGLIEEWMKLPWKDERREQEADGFENHLCFPAGTPISVPGGTKPIDELGMGDVVLTRNGPRILTQTGMTGVRRIWELELSDGRCVHATRDHPFYVHEKGFLRLDELLYGDRLVEWQNQKPSFSRASTTDATQSLKDAQTAFITSRPLRIWDTYIDESGRAFTDPYRPVTTSTTSTTTHSTTPSKTSIASLSLSTSATTCVSHKTSSTQDEPSSSPTLHQRNGMQAKRAESGTASTVLSHGLGSQVLGTYVPFVATDTRRAVKHQTCAPGSASLDNAETAASTTLSSSAQGAELASSETNTPSKNTVPVHVVRVAPTLLDLPVYALSVDTDHEYYAHGLLVSNSDAALYAYRECKAWANEPALPSEPEHTPLWWENEEKRIWEEHDEFQRQKQDDEAW